MIQKRCRERNSLPLWHNLPCDSEGSFVGTWETNCDVAMTKRDYLTELQRAFPKVDVSHQQIEFALLATCPELPEVLSIETGFLSKRFQGKILASFARLIMSRALVSVPMAPKVSCSDMFLLFLRSIAHSNRSSGISGALKSP